MQGSCRALLALCALALAASRSFAADPAFEFDGQKYFLKSTEGGISEYLPSGETFEKWTTLISVREFPSIDDRRSYAEKVVAEAKAGGPPANGQVLENAQTGTSIADFLVFSPKGSTPSFAEWNLMRIEKNGPGIQVVQYARRFYRINDSTSRELVAARQKIIPLLATFHPPR